ncbi:G:T-mismatch repair DNA endonuclease (very short patch repair protein) [Conyzicola nivalis]|uniref:G:T-mismatch repair DNA endonuclease (Very short patch repair protein) n=1 Tax=Conyzicola nivalis TaxID=1477021 RepID=A0ABV2QKU5_9MICO
MPVGSDSGSTCVPNPRSAPGPTSSSRGAGSPSTSTAAWHGCPLHATTPKSNESYWLPKLARNVERDAQSTASLEERGWLVLRFWEHETVDAVVARIAELLPARTITSEGSAERS